MTTSRGPAALLLALALLTGLTLAACGSSSKKSDTGASSATTAAGGGTTASTAAGGASATTSGGTSGSTSGPSITISGFAFNPDKVTASAGAKIAITNKDGVEHTVTADDGSFHTPVTGETATLTAPSKPGTYPFHCNIHTTMKGTLVVS